MFAHRWIVVAALMMAGLAVPTAASAHAAPLTVTPSQPIRNQTFTVKGTLTPKFARPVRLQRYVGGRWTTTRTTESTSSGRYSFTVASGASTVTMRAYAPKNTHKGHTYRAQKSPKRVIRPVPVPVPVPVPAPAMPDPTPPVEVVTPETSLSVATAADHTVRADVVSTPPVAGRTVEIQHLVEEDWITDATSALPASGRGTVSFDAPAPGTMRYRAVVSGAGLPTSSSSEVTVLIESPVARVDIRTDDSEPITSGKTYLPGEIVVDPRGSGLAASTTRTRVRVRGNSTAFVKIKLSYKIKLDKKTSLLGLPASKDWALLANFFDRSLIRNEVAFEASRRVGLPWTPRMRFAELWVDGSFRGVYQLGENIEAEQGRVVVPEAGYLLEGDSHDDDDPRFRTRRGFQVYVKEPGDADAAQVSDAAGKVQAAEDAMYAGDLSKIDVRSFVDWYIVNELLKNIDSAINNSDWMVLSADGTLAMGPVWDFDQSMGNRAIFGSELTSQLYTGRLEGLSAPSQIRLPEGHWYNQLLDNPAFVTQLTARWRQVREPLAGLSAHSAKLARELRDVAPRNFAEGDGGAGLPIGPSILDDGPAYLFHASWFEEVTALETWIAGRYAWMDDHLSH